MFFRFAHLSTTFWWTWSLPNSRLPVTAFLWTSLRHWATAGNSEKACAKLQGSFWLQLVCLFRTLLLLLSLFSKRISWNMKEMGNLFWNALLRWWVVWKKAIYFKLEFTLTLLLEKFRESNDFTKKVTKSVHFTEIYIFSQNSVKSTSKFQITKMFSRIFFLLPLK